MKRSGFCTNCLKAEHTASKCRVNPACRKCHKAHHTLLHIDVSKPQEDPTTEMVSSVTHVPQPRKRKQVLLMTCHAKVTGPDGTTTQARVFLDPRAACSFITERLAQQLGLLRWKDNFLIAGIAGVNAKRMCGIVNFTVPYVHKKGKQIHVQDAFVLPKVTTDMSASPAGCFGKRKHLKGLDLADPEFGTPACVDVLPGADSYGEIHLCGRRWGH